MFPDISCSFEVADAYGRYEDFQSFSSLLVDSLVENSAALQDAYISINIRFGEKTENDYGHGSYVLTYKDGDYEGKPVLNEDVDGVEYYYYRVQAGFNNVRGTIYKHDVSIHITTKMDVNDRMFDVAQLVIATLGISLRSTFIFKTENEDD